MNDAVIEKLLMRAPQPEPPPDLLRLLESQIKLPHASGHLETRIPNWRSRLPVRRWMPALAFGLFFLSCVILIAMQASWIKVLNRENEELRAAGADLAQLKARHADLAGAEALNAELEKLRNEVDETGQLRVELEELRALPDAIARLQDANHQLKASLAAGGASDELFFEDAQKEEEKRLCVDNLKQLGLAIRVFAGDHDDRSPASFTTMSNEVGQVKYLVCPSDKSRQAYATAVVPSVQLRDHMSSYQLLTTGGKDDVFPDSIVLKCPIHYNYGLADGSVQSPPAARVREVERDGRLYLEWPKQNAE